MLGDFLECFFHLVFFSREVLIVGDVRELKSKWWKVRPNGYKLNDIANIFGYSNGTHLAISKYTFGEDINNIFVSYMYD